MRNRIRKALLLMLIMALLLPPAAYAGEAESGGYVEETVDIDLTYVRGIRVIGDGLYIFGDKYSDIPPEEPPNTDSPDEDFGPRLLLYQDGEFSRLPLGDTEGIDIQNLCVDEDGNIALLGSESPSEEFISSENPDWEGFYANRRTGIFTQGEDGGFAPLGEGWGGDVYYDRFRFFAPRYRAYTPGWGSEMLANLVWECGRWEYLFRYKRESKPENGKSGTPLQIALRKKSEFRYQAAYRYNSCWEWRGRFHYSRYAKEAVSENGFLLYQDIIYSAPKEKMKGQLRLVWFKTDSYNSRIYAYENTVLYGYAFPALYGKGVRTYLNLNWKPWQGVTCYAKAGYTFYPDMEYSGSSYTRTEGGERWDFTVQVRFRW